MGKFHETLRGAEIARPDIARPDNPAPDQTARLNNGGHDYMTVLHRCVILFH